MIDTHIKLILSVVATIITLVIFVPYVRSILRGDVRPHVFSWIIWGLTTFIVFLAQISDAGGVGAWPIGLSGVLTIVVAVLAWHRRADISITRVDWLFFAASLASLPLWYLTSDPAMAVIILTSIDVLGFGPTARKTYDQPYSESMLFFFMFSVRNAVVLLALENYSVATVLFPATISVICLLLITLALWRRRAMPAPA
ncbi:MAG: hypothetical protein OEZ10_02240 [Gammaproteobacteria bacterium]|nr:hypothetical protein [Gammaproteobacteria bacterium]